MLIVCSERVDEKNFQEILCNVKTPIILQNIIVAVDA